VIDGPALQLDVPIIFETDLAVDHVVLAMIARVSFAEATVRADIMP